MNHKVPRVYKCQDVGESKIGRDDLDRPEVCECDGWMCDRDVIDVSSTFNVIRSVVTLVRMLSILDLTCEENAAWRSWPILFFSDVSQHLFFFQVAASRVNMRYVGGAALVVLWLSSNAYCFADEPKCSRDDDDKSDTWSFADSGDMYEVWRKYYFTEFI
jgi:hypothetical protein